MFSLFLCVYDHIVVFLSQMPRCSIYSWLPYIYLCFQDSLRFPETGRGFVEAILPLAITWIKHHSVWNGTATVPGICFSERGNLWESARVSWHWLQALSGFPSDQLCWLRPRCFVSFVSDDTTSILVTTLLSILLCLYDSTKSIPSLLTLAVKVNHHRHRMTLWALVLSNSSCPCLPLCASFLLPSWLAMLLPWQRQCSVALVGLK